MIAQRKRATRNVLMATVGFVLGLNYIALATTTLKLIGFGGMVPTTMDVVGFFALLGLSLAMWYAAQRTAKVLDGNIAAAEEEDTIEVTTLVRPAPVATSTPLLARVGGK